MAKDGGLTTGMNNLEESVNTSGWRSSRTEHGHRGRLRRFQNNAGDKAKATHSHVASAEGRGRGHELAKLELAKAHGEVMAVKDVELTWGGRILRNVRQEVKGPAWPVSFSTCGSCDKPRSFPASSRARPAG